MHGYTVLCAPSVFDRCERENFSTLKYAAQFFQACEGMDCRELYRVDAGGRMTLLADQDNPNIETEDA
jgi:hypothetical protein